MLLFFETLAGSGPQPCTQRHALSSRLVEETVAVLIGYHELNSGHGIPLSDVYESSATFL